MHDDRLSEMAAKAVAKWPGLRYRTQHADGYGDRAEAAADLVRRNLVDFRGDLPVSGIDEWAVDHHTASHRGQQCSCSDKAAPVDAKLGRLCKHRLAVMMAMRLRSDSSAMLTQIISQAASRNTERITLGTIRVYAERGSGHDADRYTLASYRERGRGQVNVGGDGREPVRFTAKDLYAVLAASGWRVAGTQKQPGYQWDLYLEPAPAARPGGDPGVAETVRTGIGHLDAADAEWVERKQREARMARMMAADVDRNLAEMEPA